MAYIGAVKMGYVHNAGQFLAHAECTRETREALQSLATTVGTTKYIKMGTPYPSNDQYCVGLIYEDVDVTDGNMPCSVVTKGEVYENRLPVALDSDAKTALTGKGFKFYNEPAVLRPEYPTALTALTVNSSAGTASGDTAITVSGYTLKTGEGWKYKVATGTAATIGIGEIPDNTWTAWDGSSDITAATGKKITIIAVSPFGEAKASGNATVTAHA